MRRIVKTSNLVDLILAGIYFARMKEVVKGVSWTLLNMK